MGSSQFTAVLPWRADGLHQSVDQPVTELSAPVVWLDSHPDIYI